MTDDQLGRDLAAFLDEHRACARWPPGFTGEPERVLDVVLMRRAD